MSQALWVGARTGILRNSPCGSGRWEAHRFRAFSRVPTAPAVIGGGAQASDAGFGCSELAAQRPQQPPLSSQRGRSGWSVLEGAAA
jgi:hypothetical protein